MEVNVGVLRASEFKESLAAIDCDDVGSTCLEGAREPAVAAAKIQNAFAGDRSEMPLEELVEHSRVTCSGVGIRHRIPGLNIVSITSRHHKILA